MKRAAKIFIVACCLTLCAGAMILAPKENAKQTEPKTQVAPVNNREQAPVIWMQV
jgi:hypothetical protein